MRYLFKTENPMVDYTVKKVLGKDRIKNTNFHIFKYKFCTIYETEAELGHIEVFQVKREIMRSIEKQWGYKENKKKVLKIVKKYPPKEE